MKTRLFLVLYILCGSLLGSTLQASDCRRELLNQVRQSLTAEQYEPAHSDIVQDIDSLMQLKQMSDSTFCGLIVGIGNMMRRQGRLTSAIELILEAVSCYEQQREPKRDEQLALMNLYLPLGAAHEEMGMWNRAMGYYIKALHIAEEYGHASAKAKLYNNIGVVYYGQKEYEQAEKYLQQSLGINLRTGNKYELYNNYNNLAGICLHTQREDKALDYGLKAIQLLDSEEDAYSYYSMQTNIASLYLLRREYPLAITYLRNALTHQQKYGFKQLLVQTYDTMAEAMEKTNRQDSALHYMNLSLQLVRELDNKYAEGAIQARLAAFYQRTGQTKKAYEALLQSVAINDSISEVDNRKRMADMERVANADKKVQENELLLKDIALSKAKTDRLWIIALSVSVMLIILLLLLANWLRSKEKQRRAQEQLARQQAAHFEKEADLQHQKEQELNTVIDQRNRELTSYTLHLVKTNEFLTYIQEELKRLQLEINPRDKEHKQHLQQILVQLQQQNTTTDWNEFRYYFEQVHPSFYENLEKQCPDLTPKEKRLCAFLRLGLSSKEISAITFKEVRSVESARNRLRRKLGIGPEGNLTDFLAQHFS